MPDFIPIVNVSPTTGVFTNRPGELKGAFSLNVKMSSVYDPIDTEADGSKHRCGDVYFVARLYYKTDETNTNNVECLTGDADGTGSETGNYDFPDAYAADSIIGFRLPDDGTKMPVPDQFQGNGHKPVDYQTFTLVTSASDPSTWPICAVVAVYKTNTFGGRSMTIFHWDRLKSSLTDMQRLAQDIAALQVELDAELIPRPETD